MNRVFAILLLVVSSSTVGKLESAVLTKALKRIKGTWQGPGQGPSIFFSIQLFQCKATALMLQGILYQSLVLLLEQILYLLALNWGMLGLICAAIEFALKIQG